MVTCSVRGQQALPIYGQTVFGLTGLQTNQVGYNRQPLIIFFHLLIFLHLFCRGSKKVHDWCFLSFTRRDTQARGPVPPVTAEALIFAVALVVGKSY